MSKRTQVEQALREINQADFQRLSDAYLRRRGYTHINPLGLAFGRQKTTTGTPDTYVVRQDGMYVFAEYTTQETGVAAKFQEDLAKCFDVTKTGVPVDRIAEVVLCHNRKLQPEDELSLRLTCETQGVILTTIGLGEMAADLVEKYHTLALEFLNVPVTTGQILSPKDFVAVYERSVYATPLSTQFFARTAELEAARRELEQSKIVILAGRAGVGKSRIALEAATRYARDHGDVQVWCIYDRGAEFYTELRSKFTEPGKFLIVLDDINRISGSRHALELLRETNAHTSVKIIGTVRDYALQSILTEAGRFGTINPIKIDRMSDEEIQDLVRHTHGVHNHGYLQRIVAISDGNPRIALMAGSIAIREGTISSLDDVAALYEEYFRSLYSDLKDLDNDTLIKVAGIISFFRHVDRTHAEQMGIIADAFKVNLDEFWTNVRRLHDLEIVDLYENEVVKFSDQIMATYFFYVATFRKKSLEFAGLLRTCFPRFRGRLRDALYPVMSVYDADLIAEQMRPDILRTLESLRGTSTNSSALELAEMFASIIPERALTLAHHAIAGLPTRESEDRNPEPANAPILDQEEKILKVLGNFHSTVDETRRIAVELITTYLKKRPWQIARISEMLNEAYGIRYESYSQHFAVQSSVIDTLQTQSDEGQSEPVAQLMLEVATFGLQTKFHRYHSAGERRVTHTTFHLVETPQLRQLREKYWKVILSSVSNPKRATGALKRLRQIIGNETSVNSRDVVDADKTLLEGAIRDTFSNTELEHEIIVQELVRKCAMLQIEIDPELQKIFSTAKYKLYSLLTQHFHHSEEKDFALFRTRHRNDLAELAQKLDGAKTEAFLADVAEIYALLANHDAWQVLDSAAEILAEAISQDSNLFERNVVPTLVNGHPLVSHPSKIVSALTKQLGADGALETLGKYQYPFRWHWLMTYFQSLTRSNIREHQRTSLLDAFKFAPSAEIPHSVTFLSEYTEIDSTISLNVARIIWDRIEAGDNLFHSSAAFFNQYGDTRNQFLQTFGSDVALAKRFYMKTTLIEKGVDHNGRTFSDLLSLDQSFATEWVSFMLTEGKWKSRHDDTRNYERIWLRQDSAHVMDAIFSAILSNAESRWMFDSYLVAFFRVREDNDKKITVQQKQDAWIGDLIRAQSEDSSAMELLFEVILDFSEARQLTHIETLLSVNADIELFKRIPHEPKMRAWSGSAVPMYRREIEFKRSLLTICKSARLLPHREYLLELVARLEHSVEQAQKRDFIDEY